MMFRFASFLLASATVALADEGTLRALAKPTGNGPGTGTCEFGGNGFPSKHDYQLVLVGMNKDQASNFSPRPGDDNGRSMFVQYEGKTTIDLINSSISTSTCGGRDYKVVDADGSDGRSSFCLPDPFPPCDSSADPDCYDDDAEYAVFGRVVKGGKNSSLKLCADINGEEYCYLGSSTLPTKRATDISKQLLTFCMDGVGFGLFDELCIDADTGDVYNCDGGGGGNEELEENYFWELDADKLKLAQLRFYNTKDLEEKNPGCDFSANRADGCGR